MTAQLRIDVKGSADREVAPERAVLSVDVVFVGPEREPVYRRAVEVQQAIGVELADSAQAGAVGHWSSDAVRVQSEWPARKGGKRGQPRYRTRIRVTAEFVDLAALPAFIDTWSVVDGVEIGGLSWDVGTQTWLQVEAELRREAVADAMRKAQAYSDAVGYGSAIPVRIVDEAVGGPRGRGPAIFAVARSMSAGDEEQWAGLELNPEDITIEASVAVRCRAVHA